MILRHSLFRAHRAEQCFLLYVETSHRQCRRIDMLSVDLAEIWDFFNSLLVITPAFQLSAMDGIPVPADQMDESKIPSIATRGGA